MKHVLRRMTILCVALLCLVTLSAPVHAYGSNSSDTPGRIATVNLYDKVVGFGTSQERYLVLDWTASSNADSYIVYRYCTSGSALVCGVYTSDSKTLTLKANYGQRYVFAVAGISASGTEGPWTNVSGLAARVGTKASPKAIAHIHNLKKKSTSNIVVLSWKHPRQGAVSEYIVERKASGSSTWTRQRWVVADLWPGIVEMVYVIPVTWKSSDLPECLKEGVTYTYRVYPVAPDGSKGAPRAKSGIKAISGKGC